MAILYSTQTVVAAGGAGLLPTKITLSKSLISLHVKLTTGANTPTPDKALQVVVAATPFTVVESDAPGKLAPSYILSCTPKLSPSGVAYFKSEPIIAEGLNLHAWVNADPLGQTITLDATVVEIA